jgi:hypothetical protein
MQKKSNIAQKKLKFYEIEQTRQHYILQYNHFKI